MSDGVPEAELRAFVKRMRTNADERPVSEVQDFLAGVEQHWAAELESLIDDA